MKKKKKTSTIRIPRKSKKKKRIMKNVSAASMFLVFKHEVQQCKERKMILKYYSFLLKFLYLYSTVIEYRENQYTDYFKSYIQHVNKFKS